MKYTEFKNGDYVSIHKKKIGIVLEGNPWKLFGNLIHIKYIFPPDDITWWVDIDFLKKIRLTEDELDKIMVELL